MMKEDGLILSIAGHDPTGGAGIQTDAFIANSFGIHCLSILTCQTIQNLESFQKIVPSKRGFIQESFESLSKDFSIKFIKIGLVPNLKIANEISELISTQVDCIFVIDPILKSGNGKKIFLKKDLNILTKNLYSQASLLTPNAHELMTLTGRKNIFEGAIYLSKKGVKNLYVTGEIKNKKIKNYLFSNGELISIDESKFLNKIIHGTGCALSTSILCNLMKKNNLKNACAKSQNLLSSLVKKSREHRYQNLLKII